MNHLHHITIKHLFSKDLWVGGAASWVNRRYKHSSSRGTYKVRRNKALPDTNKVYEAIRWPRKCIGGIFVGKNLTLTDALKESCKISGRTSVERFRIYASSTRNYNSKNWQFNIPKKNKKLQTQKQLHLHTEKKIKTKIHTNHTYSKHITPNRRTDRRRQTHKKK